MQLLLTWHCFYCLDHSRRSRGSDIIQSPSEPSVPPPPELPPNTKAPWITIPTSTLPQDWSKLINSDSHADVLFHLGSEHYHAHRLVRVKTLSAGLSITLTHCNRKSYQQKIVSSVVSNNLYCHYIDSNCISIWYCHSNK